MANDFEGDVAHPRALLAPSLLLLLAEAAGHSYELMERLKPLGFHWGGPGPIYRELRALEAANLVSSAWSVPKAGPVPRVYELTPAGRQALERSAAGIVELQGLIAQYLARFRKVKGAVQPGARREPLPSPEPGPAPPPEGPAPRRGRQLHRGT